MTVRLVAIAGVACAAGTFVASPDDFVNERPALPLMLALVPALSLSLSSLLYLLWRPVCYKVACADGGQSYQLQVSGARHPQEPSRALNAPAGG